MVVGTPKSELIIYFQMNPKGDPNTLWPTARRGYGTTREAEGVTGCLKPNGTSWDP